MSDVVLTARQALKVDEYAKEKLGISTLILMENAGRSVARIALDRLDKNKNKRIAIFCGKGNNAGDGFVAVRHLITQGRDVDTYLLDSRGNTKNESGLNLSILKKISRRIFEVKDSHSLSSIKLDKHAMIIDALLGIGLKGEVAGLLKDAISLINISRIPVLAVDIPSGLDATTGQIHGIAVRADTTVTFVAKKQGLLSGEGPKYCGKIIVRDLGIPIKNYD
ncbi:NAD(P)H-hydrate epimerase [Candidatus Omnitrophota bacterium]